MKLLIVSLLLLIVSLLLTFSIAAHSAHFVTGSDVPTEELNQELMKVYREDMKDLPKDTAIKVEGHTDSRGSESYNKKLSNRRAKTVVDFFKHLNFTNVQGEGLGESQLADSGNSLESHAKNRRVVISFNNTKTVISEAKKEEPKQCKPEVKIVERKVYKTRKIKNILSLKAINGYQEPRTRVFGNSASVSASRDTTLGLQYQREVGSNVFLGAEVDLNENIGLLIGIGF